MIARAAIIIKVTECKCLRDVWFCEALRSTHRSTCSWLAAAAAAVAKVLCFVYVC
jgi:hypothetical protein